MIHLTPIGLFITPRSQLLELALVFCLWNKTSAILRQCLLMACSATPRYRSARPRVVFLWTLQLVHYTGICLHSHLNMSYFKHIEHVVSFFNSTVGKKHKKQKINRFKTHICWQSVWHLHPLVVLGYCQSLPSNILNISIYIRNLT